MSTPAPDLAFQLKLVPVRLLRYRDERPRIVDAFAAARFWRENIEDLEDFETEIEHLVAIYLGVGNDVIGFRVLCKGVHNAAIFNITDVFVGAAELGASSVILAHNHPDGSIEPSGEDIRTGQRLLLAADFFGITLRDLLVIGLPSSSDARWWSSLRELGHLQKLDVAKIELPPADTSGLAAIPEGEADLRFAVQFAAVKRDQSVGEFLSEFLLTELRKRFIHGGLLGMAPSASVARCAGSRSSDEPPAHTNAS